MCFLLRCSKIILACFLLGGCAGYSGTVQGVRTSLLAGDKAGALSEVNGALGVDTAAEMPEEIEGATALLLLERATVKQGVSQFKSSAFDFRVADKHLELLDLKNDTAGNIGKYLFSDDATVYKAPAYEKLLLNTMNMINYLSQNDLEGARVEARRLQVMQDYLAETSERDSLQGLGSYLAGFAFEMSGQAEKALAHYDEALTNSRDLADDSNPSFVASVRRLAGCTEFRTDSLRRVMGEAGPSETCQKRQPGKGTILVISTVGLAPYKVAKRIPIGAALVIAGAYLGALQTSQAQQLAARGLLTFINFPVMERTAVRFDRARVAVDKTLAGADYRFDLTAEVLRAWDGIKGQLMFAAITRMIARALAGVAAEQAVKSAGGNGIGALVAGLAVQGALTAADTPDTRSWVTLPSQVFIARREVSPGTHEVEVAFEGQAGRAVVKKEATVVDGGYAVIFVASMR